LIYKISSTCFGQSFAHLQERKTEIFKAYGIVPCCCGRQGFGERQRGTTCPVWRKLFESNNCLHTVHIVPRCLSPNPCLPQQEDTIPYAVNISVLRSWRWAKDYPKHVELILEINKLLLLYLVGSSKLLYNKKGHSLFSSKFTVHSVEQKSIGLKFSKSRTGSEVRYSCHHNSSRFTFLIFAHSWRFSVFPSSQSIIQRIY